METRERLLSTPSGWLMLFVSLVFFFGGVGLTLLAATRGSPLVIPSILLMFSSFILFKGHFTLQPNEGCVLNLFGKYVGTVRESGFHWTNPFYTKRKISLRAQL